MRKPSRVRGAGLLCLLVATGAAAQEPTAAEGLVLLPDGTPAAGALVEFAGDPDFGGVNDAVRRTDADIRGRFRFEALPPGEYRWTAVAAHGAPTTGSVPVGGEAPKFHVLRLRRPLKFAGVVVGPDDAPLPDARVVVDLDPRDPLAALNDAPYTRSGFSDDIGVRAYASVTDAAGRFALPSVLPKEYSRPGLVVSRHGYATLRLQAPYGRAAGELRLRLQRAAAVAVGRVLGPDGGGLADVRVDLVALNTPLGELAPPIASTATNADGAFRFDGLTNGRYATNVSARGFARSSVEVAATELAFVPCEHRLRPARDVTVVLRTPKGPPAEAEVWIEEAASGLGVSADEDGTCVVEDVPASAASLTVSVAGVGFRSVIDAKLVPDADGRLEIALEPSSDESARAVDAVNDAPPEDAERVAGRVVDAAGRPIAGALVVRHALRRAAPNRPFERRGARTDKDGRFALRGEPGRPHRYVVSAPGYATHVAETDPRTASVEFALRDGYSLAGRVVDDAGLPLAGVSVVAEPQFDGKRRDDRDDREDLAGSGFTEPDGTFCFDGLPTPRVRLRAEAPDFVFHRDSFGTAQVVDVAAGAITLVGARVRGVWIRAVDAESRPIADAADRLRFGLRKDYLRDAFGAQFDDRAFAFCVVEDGPFVVEVDDRENPFASDPAAIVTERDLVPGAGPHGADLATAVFRPAADVVFVGAVPDGPSERRVTLRRADDARVGWRTWRKRETTTLKAPHGVYDAFVGADVATSRFGLFELHRTTALGRVEVGPGGATIVLPPPEPFGVVKVRVASQRGPLRDVVAALRREDGAPLALRSEVLGAVALPQTDVAVPLNATSPVRDAFAVAVRLPAVRVRIRVSDDRGRSADRTVDVVSESVVEVTAEL